MALKYFNAKWAPDQESGSPYDERKKKYNVMGIR